MRRRKAVLRVRLREPQMPAKGPPLSTFSLGGFNAAVAMEKALRPRRRR